MKRYHEWMILMLVVVLGIALRVYHIGEQSLWLDELFSVLLAQRDLPAVIAGTAQDTMPPLYYLLLHIPLTFGSDEVAARAVSLFL